MTGHRARPALAGILVVVVLSTIAAPPGATAGGARDYAYILLQGRVTDPVEGRPVPAVVVVMTAETETYRAVTDVRGVFKFEKLPIRVYDVTLTTAEGRIIRSARKIDMGEVDLTRLEIKVSRGEANPFRLATTADRLEVSVPKPPPSWNKFWMGLGLFFVVTLTFLAL